VSFVTPAVFVVAECFEIGDVEVVDASGELGVMDGGDRHRLRGVEDPPGDSGHLRWGVEPAQNGVELLAEAFLMVVHATLGTVMATYRWASDAREW
jgi:hypothetical protein